MVTNTAIPANPLEEAARITEEMILKGVLPGLGVLRVGAEPDHVALEEELVSKARTMGIVIEKYIMNAKSEESDVIDVIEVLNTDYKLHAVVMPVSSRSVTQCSESAHGFSQSRSLSQWRYWKP